MSSIRPFVTLTIIVIVGVMLFRKINEGPAHVSTGGTETFQNSAIEGAPPLASTGAAPTWPADSVSTEPAAPRWADPVTDDTTAGIPPINVAPPTTGATALNGVGDVASTQNINNATPPGIPPIPALPPLTNSSSQTASTSPAVPQASIEPPASVPMASYPNDTTATEATPAAPTATPFDTTAASPPTTPSAEQASSDDRYGMQASTSTTEPAEPVSPLVGTWPEIQAALDRQQLAQAHEMLSGFYGNPALSSSEAEQVEQLLSQLAGSVVYSTEHRLEPPYVVNSGETLETIAKKYDVPWQLLAKINGVPAIDLVQPGQELKVVRGPFSAVVDLTKGQLTLMLGDRYAGRFPVIAEPTAQGAEGQWTVEQKLVNPPTTADGVVSASYNATPPTADRVLVLRSETPQGGSEVISIASGSTPATGPTAVAPPAFRVSQRDAEELSDSLSVGSRITIRR